MKISLRLKVDNTNVNETLLSHLEVSQPHFENKMINNFVDTLKITHQKKLCLSSPNLLRLEELSSPKLISRELIASDNLSNAIMSGRKALS